MTINDVLNAATFPTSVLTRQHVLSRRVRRTSALPSEGTRELAGLYLSWWGSVWSSRPNQLAAHFVAVLDLILAIRAIETTSVWRASVFSRLSWFLALSREIAGTTIVTIGELPTAGCRRLTAAGRIVTQACSRQLRSDSGEQYAQLGRLRLAAGPDKGWLVIERVAARPMALVRRPWRPVGPPRAGWLVSRRRCRCSRISRSRPDSGSGHRSRASAQMEHRIRTRRIGRKPAPLGPERRHADQRTRDAGQDDD